MIPKSVLDMINEATEKAHIITALEYIKKECVSNTEYCNKCPFYIDNSGMRTCFFNSSCYGTVPMEWNLEKLSKKLSKGE